MQKDPLGYIPGLNLYRFAKNSPIQYIDLLGLCDYDADVTLELLREELEDWSSDPYNPKHVLEVIELYDHKNEYPGDRFFVPGIGYLAADELGNYSAGWVAANIYGPVVAFYGTWAGGIAYEWNDRRGLVPQYPLDDWGSIKYFSLGIADGTSK